MSKGQYLGDFEQLVLLAILRLKDNAYGVTIRREIETRAERRVASGAIYSTLERLLDKGHISSTAGEPEPMRGGRAKTFYHVEPTGLAALEETERAYRRMRRGLTMSPVTR